MTSRPGNLRRRALTALTTVLCLTMAGGRASAASLVVEVSSRALAPGELVVFTITADGPPSMAHVKVFGRDASAFDLGQGRWQALVGIDLDQKPGRYTATIEVQVGAVLVHDTRELVVRAKRFPTRALRVDPGFVNPSPAQMTRVTAEAAFLREAYLNPAPTRLWTAPFVRPVPGVANSSFGSRSIFNGQPRSPHGGADLLRPAGTPIKAPNAGRVVCARDLFFTGNTVIIDHGLGLFSTLAHLSRVDVREGDIALIGQVVGLVGATGRVTGPHLHWAVLAGGARVDPLSALALLGEDGSR